jgi:hypothetical protein
MQIDSLGLRLPDFLIVGAARSGTTTLYYQLRQHPDIFMPDLKEPFFFTFAEDGPREYASLADDRERRWDLPGYSDLFATAAEGQMLGEASTSYLYFHDRSIRNMRDIYGDRASDLRILAVLRDPVERTFSNYLLLRSRGWDDLSFDEYLDLDVTGERRKIRWDYDYVGLGKYSSAVRAYQNQFPHTRFYLYEDLASPEAMLEDLWSFLDIAPPQRPVHSIRANAGGLVRRAGAERMLEMASRTLSPVARRLPVTWRVRIAG